MARNTNKGGGEFAGGVGQNIVANICGGVLGATCVSLGLAQSSDLTALDNWPAWLAVLGLLVLAGFGGNLVRLGLRWWKRRNIPSSGGERIGLLVAALEGDADHRPKQREVVSAIERELGDAVHITIWPEPLALPDGRAGDALALAARTARGWLAQTGCDLLVWGHVKGDKAIELRFASADAVEGEGRSYGLSADTLELPRAFNSDLGGLLVSRLLAEFAVAKNAKLFEEGRPSQLELMDRVRHRIEPLLPSIDTTVRRALTLNHLEILTRLGSFAGVESPAPRPDLIVPAYRELLDQSQPESTPFEQARLEHAIEASLFGIALCTGGEAALELAQIAFQKARSTISSCDWTERDVRQLWADIWEDRGVGIYRLYAWLDVVRKHLPDHPDRYREPPDLEPAVACLNNSLYYYQDVDPYFVSFRVPRILMRMGNVLYWLAAEKGDVALAARSVEAFQDAETIRESYRIKFPLPMAEVWYQADAERLQQQLSAGQDVGDI